SSSAREAWTCSHVCSTGRGTRISSSCRRENASWPGTTTWCWTSGSGGPGWLLLLEGGVGSRQLCQVEGRGLVDAVVQPVGIEEVRVRPPRHQRLAARIITREIVL